MSNFFLNIKVYFGFILISASIFTSGLAVAESSGKIEFASTGVVITFLYGASTVASKGVALNSDDSIFSNAEEYRCAWSMALFSHCSLVRSFV